MTKKEITLLKKFYATRIESLKFAIKSFEKPIYSNLKKTDNLLIMLAEYSEKLDNLSIDKEYMIAFEGGGWNTTRATNDEDALKFAKAEYDGEYTKVSSVYPSSPSSKDAAIKRNSHI
jgi:hypothetical protein